MNIPLTLMMFAVLPLMLVTTRYFNKRMRYVFKERNKQVARSTPRWRTACWASAW